MRDRRNGCSPCNEKIITKRRCDMLKDKVTCLIFSCDKFSDLWDGNIKLFNENWPNRDFETYIVTDKITDKLIPGIGIIAAGANMEWSDRLKYALQYVKTEYVFVTLDDYFLIKKVDNNKMDSYLSLMINGGYDYLRFYPRPKRATRKELSDYKGVYHVDTSCNYSVNLYSCFWTKKFLEYTVRDPKNAWMFEISLSQQAVQYGAKCLCSYNDDYVILDVVRKGKILHKANRYFKKHPGIYQGNRELQSWKYEAKLWVKTMFARYTPNFLIQPFRSIFVKTGGQSFTQDTHR